MSHKILAQLFKIFSLIIAIFLLSSPSKASTVSSSVEVYPAPSGIAASGQYSVQILQDGKTFPSFVYQIQNPGFLSNGQSSDITTMSTREQSTAWSTFSFSGDPVTVQITNNRPFTAARILPSSFKIVPAINGQVVSFSVSDTIQVAVDFCYNADGCPNDTEWDISNPMLVFSNPLQGGCAAGALIAKPGQPVPALNASQSMVCFGPGVYDLGMAPYILGITSAGVAQNAFLAGGAYVKGTFTVQSGATGTIIGGRGILSGEDYVRGQCQDVYGGTSCPYMINGANIAGSSLIQGITLINAPFYNIMLGGANNTVLDIKELAWFPSTDGISAGGDAQTQGSYIGNSFFKVGDDAIKLFSNDLLVSGCNIWQLNNAAPFEFGVNQFAGMSNIIIQNSNVLRTETDYPNRSDAVFNTAQGGDTNMSNYTFNNIHVENSNFQLFKMAIIPNIYTKPVNDLLGSISNLTFNNITVSDPQTLPDLFQSFDLKHQISNVVFNNVTEGGVKMPSPSITFNANRNISLGGTVFSGLLWRSKCQPDNFQISLFSGSANNPSSTLSLTQSQLTAGYQMEAIGDFYGDGYASALVENTTTGQLSMWEDPVSTNLIYPLVNPNGQQALASGVVAGVGDFNGDGHSDVLFWNSASQTGSILLMNGSQVASTIKVQPVTASNWSVAGIGDFDETGYSDILLRDTNGNVEVLYFGKGGFVSSMDFTPGNFFYSSTSNYNQTSPAVSGHFDTNWTVAGVGDFRGSGYASILWTNSATGQIAMTNFDWNQHKVLSGQVFANIPAGDQIVSMGDYNGDGAKDILLYNSGTQQYTIWYLNYYNGALYQVGPTLGPGPSADWQIQGGSK